MSFFLLYFFFRFFFGLRLRFLFTKTFFAFKMFLQIFFPEESSAF